MAKIDTDGLQELTTNIKNPLKHLWEKLDKAGVADSCLEEFDYIHKFLNTVETQWSRSFTDENGTNEPEVMVNGKRYTVAAGPQVIR